ncbi:MAG: thioesterase family protein [Bacteroidota bacterium]|nr:thioesterase family protein [Bacteroidota bacterium]
MGRIKLEIPSKKLYEHQIEIRVDDLNYGQHLGNEMILVYAQQTRIKWLESWNYSELSIEQKSIIQGDAAIEYQSEGFLNNQIITSLFLGTVGRASFELYYLFFNKSLNKVLARAKTGIVFYDYSLKKSVSIPEAFKEKLSQVERGFAN